MRMLLKVGVPVAKGNEAYLSGALMGTVQATMETLKPEAAYFGPDPETGRRMATFVFDMEASWQLPTMLEPLFENLEATIHMAPVMNVEDLQRGFKEQAAA
jgi:hypothetical protein